MLQLILITNLLGMIYLPIVLISIMVVMWTETDVHCSVGMVPVIALLGVKVGPVELVVASTGEGISTIKTGYNSCAPCCS